MLEMQWPIIQFSCVIHGTFLTLHGILNPNGTVLNSTSPCPTDRLAPRNLDKNDNILTTRAHKNALKIYTTNHIYLHSEIIRH